MYTNGQKSTCRGSLQPPCPELPWESRAVCALAMKMISGLRAGFFI